MDPVTFAVERSGERSVFGPDGLPAFDVAQVKVFREDVFSTGIVSNQVEVVDRRYELFGFVDHQI